LILSAAKEKVTHVVEKYKNYQFEGFIEARKEKDDGQNAQEERGIKVVVD